MECRPLPPRRTTGKIAMTELVEPGIECRYSCHRCGISKRVISIKPREPGADISGYMKGVVVTTIQKDHMRVSPHCRATSISEVMLHIPSDGGIGYLPKN